MKTTKIISILIIFLLFSCKQKESVNEIKTEKELVTELELYEVINFMLPAIKSNNQMNSNYVTEDVMMKIVSKENNYLELDKMDSLFTKNDAEFIKKQLKGIDKFKLKQKLMLDKIIIPSDTLSKFQNNKINSLGFWENYRQKYGNKGFHTISLPLFSLDKKTVIITIGFHCGGLCGGGATEIYKKINGKWTLIKTLNNWVS
jgi:hypothetical protein